ncbi:HIT family protein [Patescibacteria group bacterium]|nr:HIT family protein [Patescibacteria group bacterium]MBU4023131.1 HIT family protein [Patescibacteria group bacterium]MBU4078038.1 HIT family protein [Patescibacteria group bacterium]
MEDCIFCKIVKGEIPCYKIYENKKAIAFLDINPIAKGHILVLPKNHYENIFEIDEESIKEVALAIKNVAILQREKLGLQGMNIFQANNAIAGQTIFHIHFHLVPRYAGDNINAWPKSNYFEKDIKGLHKLLTK